MDIRFGDHPSFHRAAAGMVGISAVLGLGLHAIRPSAVNPAIAPLVAGLLGIAIGCAIAYGKPKWRIGAAVAATVPLFVMPPSWAILAGIAALMALAIGAYGLRGTRGALAVMLGATVTLVAMWAALRIGHARATIA